VRLFLVRHADAAPGEPDELRPLTEGGRDAARRLGETLARERPDAILASPLLRARETAEQIASAAGLEPQPDRRLGPGTTADTVRATIAGKGETVVVVAHQPDCSEIALALTGREIKFPPGAVFAIDL
jgi:phosphohistidine phosphatase